MAERLKEAASEGVTLALVLDDSLRQRWQKYLKELRRCKRSFSEESIHDLRVATRRLISLLIIVETLYPDPKIRWLQRRLKKFFDALSPLRDTQVQLLMLEREVAQFPELETLITMLKVREQNHLKKIAVKVIKLDNRSLSRSMSSIKKRLREHLTQPVMHAIAAEAVHGIAASRFMTALTMKERVMATRPHTIHRARIAFKKLRYTLEALLPLLPAVSKEQLKAMDAYQTRMGQIQDLELMTAMLRRFASRRTLASRRKLAAFRNGLLRQKRSLIAEYLHLADDLHYFWNYNGTLFPSSRNR